MKPGKMRSRQIYKASHKKRSKQVGSALSDVLRSKYNHRSVRVFSGDNVTVVRGEYKSISGKVVKVLVQSGRVTIEGIKRENVKGEKLDVPIHASNLVITALNTSDPKRMEKLGLNPDEAKAAAEEHLAEEPAGEEHDLQAKPAREMSEEGGLVGGMAGAKGQTARERELQMRLAQKKHKQGAPEHDDEDAPAGEHDTKEQAFPEPDAGDDAKLGSEEQDAAEPGARASQEDATAYEQDSAARQDANMQDMQEQSQEQAAAQEHESALEQEPMQDMPEPKTGLEQDAQEQVQEHAPAQEHESVLEQEPAYEQTQEHATASEQDSAAKQDAGEQAAESDTEEQSTEPSTTEQDTAEPGAQEIKSDAESDSQESITTESDESKTERSGEIENGQNANNEIQKGDADR